MDLDKRPLRSPAPHRGGRNSFTSDHICVLYKLLLQSSIYIHITSRVQWWLQFLKDRVSYTTGIIRQEKMSEDRNTYGAKGLLYSVYFKVVNSAKKKKSCRCDSLPEMFLLCLNKKQIMITFFSCLSQRLPHSEHFPDYGAYRVFHSERLSLLCGFSEEVCPDTLC